MGYDYKKKTILEIKQAFNKVWECATNQNNHTLMHIPPNRELDADFILVDAIEELRESRLLLVFLHDELCNIGEISPNDLGEWSDRLVEEIEKLMHREEIRNTRELEKPQPNSEE